MEFSSLDSHALIQSLVDVKKELSSFSEVDLQSFVSASAYDTAWVAMIPDSCQPFSKPMFADCLDWVLKNQRQDGSWGECDSHGNPTIESLPATLACMVALRKWNAGETNVQKGIAFLEANIKKLVEENCEHYPRWFAIVFPAMIELAQTVGLDIASPDRLKGLIVDLYYERRQILAREELVDKYHYPPLLAYLEALPPSFDINREHILSHLSDHGSLFQSPSATACAFMVTGDQKCLASLQSLVQKCANNGVPLTFPMDEDLIKLCVVNNLQKLGLAEHFNQEIEEVLSQVYRNYKNNKESFAKSISIHTAATRLFKDSLAFELLRIHGYSVSPGMFCWFLHDQEIQDYLKRNKEYFSSGMLNVYRATNLMFPEENEAQEARSFSGELLEKILSAGNGSKDEPKLPSFQNMIKRELDLPWLTRLEHLEHRRWIEENNVDALWMGKTCFHRLSSFHNDKLINLAKQNYEFRQSIYKYELEELKRWSKDMGLSDMGFGRERTTYSYFTAAASVSLPYDSIIRSITAKSAIIITLTDDFFDTKGSLDELNLLTNAIKRWDSKGLSGHSKTIFDALHDLVSEVAAKYYELQGKDIIGDLKNLWHETFDSWLTEAKWSRTGFIPSMDEYMKAGMTSVATHTLVLIASCLLTPSLSNFNLRPTQYDTVTQQLMLITRLLNDTQSYQREKEDGKMNFVLLHMKENPNSTIEDSVAHVREIIARKEKELLEHVTMDGLSDLPRPCRLLHLSCLKVFYMFYGLSNRYDSDTELLQDIQKGIYVPPKVETRKIEPQKPICIPIPMLSDPSVKSKKKKFDPTVLDRYQPDYRKSLREVCGGISMVPRRVREPNILRGGYGNMMMMTPKFKSSFAHVYMFF